MFIRNRSFAAALTLLGCIAVLPPAALAAETMTTGVDATFAPMAMQRLDGKLEGFNVDLGHALAKQLGVNLKIEPTQFNAIIPALNSKKYDFALAPTTATKERAQSMLFSEGYYNTDYIFVQKKNAPAITKLEDLKGKTITVNSGSAYESWAKANEKKYGFKYQVFGTNADAIQAVLSGRADTNLSGNTTGAWAAKKNPLLKTSYTIKTGLVWALVFRKDDTAGRKRVSDALKCLKKKGVISELAQKWFQVTPKPGSVAVTVDPGEGVPGLPGYDSTPASYKCSS